MRKSKENGFTMIDALFALLITCIVSLLSCVLIQVCFRFTQMDLDTQNQYAILQLRQTLSMANSIQIQDNHLECVMNHEKVYFYLDQNRIVKSPGYEIFLEHIEDAGFYEKEKHFYVWFQKEKNRYEFELY